MKRKKISCIELDCFHKFEPRYDETSGQSVDGIREAGRFNDCDAARHFLDGVGQIHKKTYVCDICIMCGEVVERVS